MLHLDSQIFTRITDGDSSIINQPQEGLEAHQRKGKEQTTNDDEEDNEQNLFVSDRRTLSWAIQLSEIGRRETSVCAILKRFFIFLFFDCLLIKQKRLISIVCSSF